MDIAEFVITVLSTGVVTKSVDYFFSGRKQKKEGDTTLQLSEKSELYNFRQWLADEVESLTEISEKIKEEKHQLEMKVVILERDLIDERRFSSEQADEILELNAERESLKAQLAHFNSLAQREVVIEE